MEMYVDVTRIQFRVGRAPEPKTARDTGRQMTDRETQLPLWVVQLSTIDATGADKIRVTVAAAQQPKVDPGQEVVVRGLRAIPWEQNGRAGVAFRAESVGPITATKAA